MEYNYKEYIRTVENFPKDGVEFYDITPLIGNGAVFASLITEMAEPLRGKIDRVVGYDARGFIFASAIAKELGIGMAMLRKAGKLPGETINASYDLEYGTSSLELQVDALKANEKVALVDDLIATGGTGLAGLNLVRNLGAEAIEFLAVIDLPDLGGSQKITEHGVPVRTITEYKA